MNICIISPFPLYQPPQSYVGALESWWKPISEEHNIISISFLPKNDEEWFYPNSKIIDIRVPAFYLPVIPYVIPNPLSLLRTIKKVEKRYDVDIYHVIKLMFITSYISTLYINKIIKKPLVVSIHGENKYFPNNIIGMMGRLYKKFIMPHTLRLADSIITLDKGLLRDIRITKDKDVYTVRITPDITRFSYVNKEKARKILNIPPKKFIVLFIGSLRSIKGIEYLHEVAVRITNEYNDINFIFLGDGPLRKQLDNNKTDGIDILGYVKNTELYLAASDLFILTSLSEGLPMAVLEALAMSLPVIVTRVGALNEIIKKENGILIEPRNKRQLYEAIIYLYKNQHIGHKMGINNHLLYKKEFNQKDITEKINKIYFKTSLINNSHNIMR